MPPRVDNYEARPVLPHFEMEEQEALPPAVFAQLMNLREPENAGGIPFAPGRINRAERLIARWVRHPVQRVVRNARNVFQKLARCLQIPR